MTFAKPSVFGLIATLAAFVFGAPPVGALAQNGWLSNGMPAGKQANLATSGDFAVMQIATDKSDQLMADWVNPKIQPHISSATSTPRNKAIVTFIIFRGCRAAASGNCNVTVDYDTLAPDGRPYDTMKASPVWVGHPPPPGLDLQLSESAYGLIFENKDALGDYHVRATITDHVAGVTLNTEQVLTVTATQVADPFRFEAETSVDDMFALVRRNFSTSSTREQVRAAFVDEGGATLIIHPHRTNVEKYIYDIDLCHYYVWRWNISADYGADDRLKQIYVNGSPMLGGAKEPDLPKKGPFYQIARPRPQAFKGEKSLAAIVSSGSDPLKIDDAEILTGIGPTRADPLDMGRAVNNRGELWRSIFDLDDARVVVPYAGDCTAVDAKYANRP